MRRIKCYRVERTPVEYTRTVNSWVVNNGCEFACEVPDSNALSPGVTLPTNAAGNLLNVSGNPAFQSSGCASIFSRSVSLKWYPDFFSELKFTAGATFPFTGVDYELYDYRYGCWIGYLVSDATTAPSCALYIELDLWGYDTLPSHAAIQLNSRSCYRLGGTQYSLTTGASQTLFGSFPIDITYSGHPSDLNSLHIAGV